VERGRLGFGYAVFVAPPMQQSLGIGIVKLGVETLLLAKEEGVCSGLGCGLQMFSLLVEIEPVKVYEWVMILRQIRLGMNTLVQQRDFLDLQLDLPMTRISWQTNGAGSCVPWRIRGAGVPGMRICSFLVCSI
jgi:hypothetical protein